MSDRAKNGWGWTSAAALVAIAAAIIKGSFYLGTVAQDVGHVRIGVQRIEAQINSIEARVAALERHRYLLEDMHSQRLNGYKFANPDK